MTNVPYQQFLTVSLILKSHAAVKTIISRKIETLVKILKTNVSFEKKVRCRSSVVYAFDLLIFKLPYQNLLRDFQLFVAALFEQKILRKIFSYLKKLKSLYKIMVFTISTKTFNDFHLGLCFTVLFTSTNSIMHIQVSQNHVDLLLVSR